MITPKRFISQTVLALLVMFPLLACAEVPTDIQGRPLYVEGQVLVKFRDSVPVQQQADWIRSLGHSRETIAIDRRGNGVQLVNLPTTMSMADAMATYAGNADVEYVQPNYIYYPTALPDESTNATGFQNQWGFRNVGQMVAGVTGTVGKDMDMELAWNEITDCRGADPVANPVIVAVIDSGVNYTHQDLAANMWTNNGENPNDGVDDDNNGYIDDYRGWDFIGASNDLANLSPDNDPMPSDASGHGSHVAGTIGAVGNNNNLGTGVCWQAKIMPLRALSNNGGTIAAIAAAINYAVANGAKVINMSLGVTLPVGSLPTDDNLFRAALQNALDNDVVVVVAAGNDGINVDGGQSTTYPCAYPHANILCVAALDQSYALASFSNRGVTSVDVGAPGTNVYSTWPGTNTPLIADDFKASTWTIVNNGANGWSQQATCTLDANNGQLTNPLTWCTVATAQYEINTDDVAYRGNLNLGDPNIVGAGMSIITWYLTETNADFLYLGYDAAGGNPFDAMGNDGPTARFSGVSAVSGGNVAYTIRSADISGCAGSANCAVGFRFTSNAVASNNGQDLGVGIRSMTIDVALNNANDFKYIQGTSMATPHVAGLATMLRAYNPNYTYADVIAAIKNGGDAEAALNNLTSSGKAANAMGALAHIQPPSNVSASVTLQ